MTVSTASAIQTTTLATPIQVQAGDVIGVAVPAAGSTAQCLWDGGSIPTSDQIIPLTGTVTPGGGLTALTAATLDFLVNMSANLFQSEDVAITQTVSPGSIATGGTGVFLLSVSGAGGPGEPVTVTDAVPTGLTIDDVVAGPYSCTVSGQIISCTGFSTPSSIAVVVTGTQAGSYVNNASVSGSLTDPNLANNTSSSSLAVTAPISTALTTVKIRFSSLAKLTLAQAKTVIKDLGMKVGEVTEKRSKTIKKGSVISTSAKAGQQIAIGSTIAISTSSGKPAAKKKRSSRRGESPRQTAASIAISQSTGSQICRLSAARSLP